MEISQASQILTHEPQILDLSNSYVITTVICILGFNFYDGPESLNINEIELVKCVLRALQLFWVIR